MRTCTNCKGRIWPHERYHVTKLGSRHRICPEAKVPQEQRSAWERHVKLVSSMALETIYGKGPTDAAFVANLRLIADAMEKMLHRIEKQ